VVAVRTEREPNRYEPLNETHRRVAEEEEKRRIAEQEQGRSASTQPEAEPNRPGPEPRPQRPEAAPDHEPDSPEARLAAMQKELEEKVKLGRINNSEMIYQLRQFDNELRIEMEQGGTSAQRGSPGAESENARARERTDDIRDQPTDQSRDDPSQRTPEARIEREAEAAEHEIVGRGEMTDARAARLERLRGIDRTLERETRENDGNGLELDHDSGDRSR